MIALTIKVTLAFAAALFAVTCAKRAAAATRHAILVAGQAVALIVPLLTFVVPAVKVEMPATPHIAPIARPMPVTASRELAPPPAPQTHINLTFLWALGAIAIATTRAISYLRATNIVRRASCGGPLWGGPPARRAAARWAARFRRALPHPTAGQRPAARRAGGPPHKAHNDGVLFSDEVGQPMTFGRHIILPRDAHAWDEQRLEAVLLHERAHVERRDSLLALLADAACAVYWFHPLAWLTARRAMLERERACDEAVLARGVAPVAYAETLLDFARVRAFGLAIADRSHLETRLRAILDPSIRRRATRAGRVLVIAGALAATPLLAALTPRPGEPDLLGDAIASPFSERIGVGAIPNVVAAGPDAAAIATMQAFARRAPHSEVDFVADRARWALAQVRDGELVAPMIASLANNDWRVRAYAAYGLGIARDRRATAPLAVTLDDRIWRVRAAAASALAEIADPVAAPAMRRALADDAWQVRVSAVHYFAAVGADRELFQSMKNDRHVAVRTATEEALQ